MEEKIKELEAQLENLKAQANLEIGKLLGRIQAMKEFEPMAKEELEKISKKIKKNVKEDKKEKV